MLTPKGLSVSSPIFLISSRMASSSPEEVSITPRPPALETAEARAERAIQPMGACTTGIVIPSFCVKRLMMAKTPLPDGGAAAQEGLLYSGRRRQPNPATLRHSRILLPLLPSGPGGVHSVTMRRNRADCHKTRARGYTASPCPAAGRLSCPGNCAPGAPAEPWLRRRGSPWDEEGGARYRWAPPSPRTNRILPPRCA